MKERTMHNIRKAINGGVGIRRKSGSGGGGKKRDDTLLEILVAKIKYDPITPMNIVAVQL